MTTVTATPEDDALAGTIAATVLTNPFIPHAPTQKQALFLLLPDREALFGGAAGGGKSDALLMGALQYATEPTYAGLILRRSYRDLALPGAIMDRSHDWLRSKARWDADLHTWHFPVGGTLTFGYLETENDKYRYQGSAYDFIGFDELTQFSEGSYRYLFSRLRRLIGSQIPPRIRSATNPGGVGHEWVRDRWGLDREIDFAQHLYLHGGRAFVPALLDENPHLDREAYRESLRELPLIERMQLEYGDWQARPGGNFFRREWLTILDHAPSGFDQLVRAWDLSAGKGDATVGVLLGRLDNRFIVLDVQRFLLPPGEQERRIALQSDLDNAMYGRVPVRIEQEGGSGGAFTLHTFVTRILQGRDALGVLPQGSKQQRAGPFAADAQNHLVSLVRGDWNRDYLDELVAFPNAKIHDDQVDASSLAHRCLTDGRLADDGFEPAFGRRRDTAY